MKASCLKGLAPYTPDLYTCLYLQSPLILIQYKDFNYSILYKYGCLPITVWSVPKVRRLVAGLSLRRLEFPAWASPCAGFVVGKGQVLF